MRRSVSTSRTYARTKHPVVSLLNVTGSILRDFLLDAKVLLVVIPRPMDGRDGAGVERLEPVSFLCFLPRDDDTTSMRLVLGLVPSEDENKLSFEDRHQ